MIIFPFLLHDEKKRHHGPKSQRRDLTISMNDLTDTTSSSPTTRRGATSADEKNNDTRQQLLVPVEATGDPPQSQRTTIPLPRPPAIVVSKKPRDKRLHECFTITLLEEGQGGGVRIVCKYCQDYVKTLQKFNPTKARTHLTTQCTGVDEALRKILLDSTQQGMRTNVGMGPSFSSAVGGALASKTAAASTEQQVMALSSSSLLASSSAQTGRKGDSSYPRSPSRASLSFHSNNAEFLVSDDASLQTLLSWTTTACTSASSIILA